MLATIIGMIMPTISKFVPDKDLAEKIKADLLKMDFELIKGQLEINKIEAAHPSVFVSGWRPFTGWTCGVSLAVFLVLVLVWYFASWYYPDLPPPPYEFLQITMPILGGLLGIGKIIRTIEKIKGVARSSITKQEG